MQIQIPLRCAGIYSVSFLPALLSPLSPLSARDFDDVLVWNP
jgi:hypothetical protein